MKPLKLIVLFAITFTFFNCDNLFEYSVYDANVKTAKRNTTEKNLKLLENIKLESQDFKFAFVTDVHYYYNNLSAVVDDINKRDDITFVIFGGDIADQALLKEFDIFYDIMGKLKKPYLTVIGNHDYNANGSIVYQEMFGDLNYSFVFNNNKFVLFDDIVWESNKDPDFDWLASELSDHAKYNQVFQIAHIPFTSLHFIGEMRDKYEAILKGNNVSLVINGHNHSYFYEEGKPTYLTVPSLKEPEYGIISVKDDTFNIEMIEL
ncbi:metallophosphoesterase [Polaribacter sp. Q13]|uniref:metallophosphoesterase family protein n=1 Tax=Polaribacter sp. Q13 TaxID=2806551 RepID=UPI00193B8E95|nr:metallophosphoesterase [Polaribacter sp. Q13]QVY66760.1 metallophosphoesterase [Polaribacter sp. Q13]